MGAGRPATIGNLIPQSERTKEEQRRIARQGGIASGEARREKKLLSQLYAEIITELYDIEGQKNGTLKDIVKAVLQKGDASTVSMLKVMGEMTEGKKIKMTGRLETLQMTPEERRARIAELEAKRNADRD